MNADDLIAGFNELAGVDTEISIEWTQMGDGEMVRLVPSSNKGAVRRFNALAADAAALFDPAGADDPETRWLRFVLDHAPELVDDALHGPVRSLGYAIEHHNDGTEKRVPFIAKTLPDAASASALVVRRCRNLIERAQAGVGDALARGQIDAPTRPVDPHANELGTTPATDSDEVPPALTPNQTRVIVTMARFDGSRLLSTAMIQGEMDDTERLSQETIRKSVRRLIEFGWAERSEGPRSGARLTLRGRCLIPKIAD